MCRVPLPHRRRVPFAAFVTRLIAFHGGAAFGEEDGRLNHGFAVSR